MIQGFEGTYSATEFKYQGKYVLVCLLFLSKELKRRGIRNTVSGGEGGDRSDKNIYPRDPFLHAGHKEIGFKIYMVH